MNRRAHLVARLLAVVPTLVAGLFVLPPISTLGFVRESRIAPGMEADSVREMTVNTVPAMAGDVGVEELPEFFTRESPGTTLLGEDDIQPELIGIAGRLPDDVEVMLRMPDGRTRSIRLGEIAGDWRLVSAQADRAVFSAGGRQVILTLAPLP